jgi:hypothetical protein
MVVWHRALAYLTRHLKTIIRPSCKGTKSFWILRILSYQAGLSVHRSHGTWPNIWTCWTSHASLPVCCWLSVWAVRCCSYLARQCEVFHNWGGKTCNTLIDRSRDARPESGDTNGVVTSTGVGKCEKSRDIQPESYLSTEVGHRTGVASSDRSQAYDRSRIFQPKSGIRPESRIQPESYLSTGVGHMTGVMKYLHYKHV